MINIPKGTKDILPDETFKWQYVEKVARELATSFNIKEIRTPIFESTELFQRGVGHSTDIVRKEMYTFLDKSGRSLTLKPEGTAGVVRSFIENNLDDMSLPVKLFYITPAFRYERPQAGRLRQFNQFGVEIFGGKDPFYDVEVITFADKFLNKLNIDSTLYINTIGCEKCRKKFNEILKEYLNNNLNKLCSDCKERFLRNPLRVFDCKNEECQKIINEAPFITDNLCEDCNINFDSVKNLLKLSNINFEISKKLVRGLDYYTNTVFEFVSNKIGAQSTICAGGRYNNLVKELGGKDINAVGFAVGIERILLAMDKFPEDKKCQFFLASADETGYLKNIQILNLLRNYDIISDLGCLDKSLKSQLKFANKINSQFVIITGTNEVENNLVNIKDMKNNQSYKIEESVFYDYIKEGKYEFN